MTYEAPKLMFEKCKQAIEKHPGLKTRGEKQAVMKGIKKMIFDNFGVVVEEEN